MYPNPAGSGQNPRQQGQPPVNGETDPNYRGPPNAQQFTSPYLQRADQQTAPGQPRSDRSEMTAMHHQHHHQHHLQHPHYQQPMEPYRNLPPVAGNLYPPPPLQDPYRGQMPGGAPSLSQSAPRQRTAIACKYCRRRKIRCSGFEHSEDGRCSNCVRFSQDCIFTPVSAQTQAFVPAQAVYGRAGRGAPQQPMQLYGAYGQPYHPGPPPQAYALPSPGGVYTAHLSQGYPPPQMYQQSPYELQPQPGRRRRTDEPHVATLPPPNPGPAAHLAMSREQEVQGYSYPDPTSFTSGPPHSPASSTTSYQSHQPQPYYAPQPVRRTSPGSIYSYEQTPESASPHVPVGYVYPPQAHVAPPNTIQGPAITQVTARPEGRSPPSPTGPGSDHGGARSGLRISEMVSESGSGGERSAADSDMLSALNRRAQESTKRS